MIRILFALALLWPGLVLGQGNVLDRTSPVYVNGNLLRSALLTARNNSTIRVLEGVYTNRSVMHVADGNVPWRMQRLTNVTLMAHGANFFWPTQVSALEIRDCENVTIDGLSMFNDKRNPNPPAWLTNWFATKGVWGAIDIHDSKNITVRNCVLDGMWDHGIAAFVGGWTTNDATNSIQIVNNRITRTGWQWSTWMDGSAIVPSSGWTVTGNTIENCGMGIELYPHRGSRAVRSVVVTGNHIHNCTGTSIGLSEVHGTTITGNVIDNDPGLVELGGSSAGISVDLVSHSTISGNTIRGRQYSIMALGPCTNVVFKGNTIEVLNSGIYISALPLVRWSIEGNSFYGGSYGLGGGYGAIYGNGTILGNNIVGNHFLNCATNPSNFAVNFNAGTLTSNRFEGNTFWLERFTNATAVSLSSATGKGNTWVNNRLGGSYTNEFAFAPTLPLLNPIQFTFAGNLSIGITNGTPTHVAGNGSLCMVTDGRLFLRTNGAWLLK